MARGHRAEYAPEALRRVVDGGESVASVARDLGVTRQAVQGVLLGCPEYRRFRERKARKTGERRKRDWRRIEERVAAGATVSDALAAQAGEAGVSVTTMRDRYRKPLVALRAQERRRRVLPLLEMRIAGASWPEILRHSHYRSEASCNSAVLAYARRHGLCLPQSVARRGTATPAKEEGKCTSVR